MQRKSLLCALLWAAVLTLAGCGQQKSAPAPRAPLPVETIAVKAADEAHWLETIGQAESGAAIEVKPQATGRILAVNYREGERVEAGRVLFEIDPSSLSAQLASAEAARRQLEDEYAQTDREWRRSKGLFEAGAGTKKALDDAASARSQKRAALAQAKADEEEARISLGWTQVKAPVAGFVSKALFNPGAVVVKESSVLASITQTEDVRVVFSPSDRDLAGAVVSTDTPVRVFRADGTEIPAALDYVAPAYDPQKGTRTMRAKIPASAGVLPGEFLRIRFQTTIDRSAWRVPQRAVKQLPDGTYAVFVLEDGRAVQKAVEVGLWEGSDWVIRSGLADGDRVITNQMIKLQNGTAVKARTDSNRASAQ